MAVKKCGRCREVKDVDDFYCNAARPDGLQPMCKGCCKQQTDRAVASGKHKEYTRASRARVNADPARLAARRKYQNRKHRERRVNDPAWREKRNAYRKGHYRANKEAYLAYASARKARKLGSGGSHSAEAWRQMRELFGNKCLCCGRGDRVTKDHIIPVSRGGTDDINNIQPLCIWCNKSKFTRGRDYRTRDKVVLAELNAVGRLLFGGRVSEKDRDRLGRHKRASRYTGVSYAPKGENSVKVWRARIQVGNRLISLGRHATEELAAAAYNEAAKRLLGERACLNELSDVGPTGDRG